MDRMQNELAASHPNLQIQILGVNEWGYDQGNANAASGKDLPLLQDVDQNGDRESDAWTSWEVTYRDVIVVDPSGEIVDIFNVTQLSLSDTDNYDELKQILIDTATPETVLGDCNLDGALDASDLSCVSDIQQRDAVLGALNTVPGDLDGDGEVAFADFLVMSDNFGKDVTSYADGNIDLQGGVDFADFLELSSNFGKTTLDAVPYTVNSDASSTDAIFGDWETDEDD